MRAYGTIKSNLKELEIKSDVAVDYSIDYLQFETPEGKDFCIDFEEGDYAKGDKQLSFRLKSLGMSYTADWENINRNKSIHIEQDYNLFKNCKLTEVGLYLHNTDNEKIAKAVENLNLEVDSIDICIGANTMYFKDKDIRVILSN